jgi:hypothetical protein
MAEPQRRATTPGSALLLRVQVESRGMTNPFGVVYVQEPRPTTVMA